MRTGLVETIEHGQDILNIFGIWVRVDSLGGQMVEAIQEKDSTKAEALFQRANNLEKHNWVPNTTRYSMPFTMKTTAASAVIPKIAPIFRMTWHFKKL